MDQDNWVDFRAVKAAVNFEMVLAHYSINGLRKNRDERRGRCPIHKGDGERAFQINVSKNVFQCFSCKARGNVLDFVAAMEGCSIRDAALKLNGWFLTGERGEIASTPAEAEKEPHKPIPQGTINPPLSFELRVDHSHDYGLRRGLTVETLEYFGAGLCLSKGMFADRFVIPLHNEVGELVGYAGRALSEVQPKYLFPSRDKGFYKSHLLFNLHRIVPGTEQIILVEGFFATMYLWQIGIVSIGLLGSSLSKEQEAMLVDRFKRVLLLFDGDDAGRTATDDCLLRLGRKLWVKVIGLPDGKQPDDLPADVIAELITSAL
jgi:DNA primase